MRRFFLISLRCTCRALCL